MILIRSTLEVKQFPSKRAWNRAKQEAHADQGQYWHQHILPLHFRRDSAQRYGHRPRSPKYLQRKKRLARIGKVKYQGLVDNVFSGLMEQTLRGGSTVRAYPSRVTVNMNGPRYIGMRVWKANQPDKAAEITRVTPDEERRLQSVLDNSLTKKLRQYGENSKTVT